MRDERHEHDERGIAIDQTLRALREIAAPEGIEARVAERLQARTAAAPAERVVAQAWWRGALCGAAAAMLVVGSMALVQHRLRAAPQGPQVSQAAPGGGIALRGGVVDADLAGGGARGGGGDGPCARPAVRVARLVAAALPGRASTEVRTSAAARQAPQLPLTEQERELVRLAQTADAKQLAAMDDETEARLGAQQAEEFKKFFTPPPSPPMPAMEVHE
jgi:hypothetical protein